MKITVTKEEFELLIRGLGYASDWEISLAEAHYGKGTGPMEPEHSKYTKSAETFRALRKKLIQGSKTK